LFSFKPVLANPAFTIYSLQFTIYDRRGEQVFDSGDIGQGWDGTKNGKPCPEGAYVYQITFNVEGIPGVEGEQTIVGTVVIVR
jgi:gliding motility-associated-like protein